MELEVNTKTESTAIVILGRALAENGLTWEDVKENIPPCLNSIGIADRDEESGGRGDNYPSVTAFALAVCRRFRLLRNDKTLFLSSEDSANTVAILLAKETGLGIEDVLVSDVYDVLRQVRASKASPDANAADHSQDAVVKSYCSRLRSSNLVDCRDVVKVIGEALEDDERKLEVSSFIRDFLASCAIMVGASDPKVSSEVDLLRLMLRGSSVKATLLRPESSLDSSLVGGGHKFSLVSEAVDDAGIIEAADYEDATSASSSTEEYCTRWAEGYLRLMVNSRDELANARILCGPFGVLDEAAFNIMRREAGKTKMPIYQTLVSYVNKLKLGGKFAPGPDHPFFVHNKGLCEFVDLSDKLQARMEEEKTEEAAAKKILGALKSHALKSGRLRLAGVERSFERLGRICEAALRASEGPREGATPKRAVGSGGSMAGRKNMKMIRGCLDRLAATVVTADVNKMLGKMGESETEAGKTPVSAPPVTSLFKTPELSESPEEVSEGAIETAGLGQRLGLGALLGADKNKEPDSKGSTGNLPKISAGMPKFGSSLAWAMESSPAVLKSSEKDPAMGTIIAKDLSKTPVSSSAKRAAEDEETAAMFEKVDKAMEVADAVVREAKESRPVLKRGKRPKRSILRDINNIKAPSIIEGEEGKMHKKQKLAPLSEVDGSKPKISKCDRDGKSLKVKSARTKKPPPLIKGQTKMTAFFRL